MNSDSEGYHETITRAFLHGIRLFLAEADCDQGRFLATTIRARSGNTSDRVYVHAKVGIVDDRWLTLGSANLNEHSFFNDTEMNVVTCDPKIARETRPRLVRALEIRTAAALRVQATAGGCWTRWPTGCPQPVSATAGTTVSAVGAGCRTGNRSRTAGGRCRSSPRTPRTARSSWRRCAK